MINLRAQAASILVSPRTARLRQTGADLAARLRGKSPELTLYYQPGDAYSHLCAQLLPDMRQRLNLDIRVVVVPFVADASNAAPELSPAYGLLDATRIAPAWGLDLNSDAQLPDDSTRELAERVLLTASTTDAFIELEPAVATALWDNDAKALQQLPMRDAQQAQDQLEANYAELGKRGHYQGGMWYFRGDWHWALDRLSYLETRLRGLGLVNGEQPLARLNPADANLPPLEKPDKLSLFYSFRSPYSYLVVERCMALTERYQLELDIRPVLPMVMRGFKVPRSKRMYIVRDTKREADRLDVPFGRIADPLGGGVERCLAAFPHADRAGKGAQFLIESGRAVWSQGEEIRHESVLRRVLERTGLDPAIAELAPAAGVDLGYAQANRDALFELGLWGVPSFQLGDLAVWGQDRVWLLEEALKRAG